MRLLIQRVLSASVTVDNEVVGKIDKGLLILAGFQDNDTAAILEKTATKVLQLRIFSDENDKMNLSVQDIAGSLLVVSQFTLYGDTKKGNRPSFTGAAHPEAANKLYLEWLEILSQKYPQHIASGIFGASMQVALVNDGPVTIWIDSEQWK